MSWNLTAAGDLIRSTRKNAEDLERELFDAIGPILTRYGAYASNFAGHHITGAPHQTTSDAAAPSGATEGEDQAAVTSPDDAGGASVPVNTGGIIDPGAAATADNPGPVADVPAPSTAAEPFPASGPIPSFPGDPLQDTGAAATS